MKWSRFDPTRWWRSQRRQRRAQVERAVREIAANTVQRGPFNGLLYPDSVGAGGSALAPKLLGTYELEIQPWIEQIIAAQPAQVVNIGAGEGYYAAGLARRLDHSRVFAYEASEESRAALVQLARINGVTARIELLADCTVAELRRVLKPRSTLVCDCEGCELALLEPAELPLLKGCVILVETHVIKGLDSANALRARFAATHSIQEVSYQPGLRRVIPGPPLPAEIRLLAVDERRRFGLRWLFLVPLGSG